MNRFKYITALAVGIKLALIRSSRRSSKQSSGADMHTQQVQASRVRRASRKPVVVARSSRKVGARWRAAAVAATLSCASVAHAESWFSFEAGLGMSSAVKTGNGIWYWSDMQHHTPNNSIAGRIGIQVNILDAKPRSWVPGLRSHLTYGYFGHLHWTSVAGEDAPPDHSYGLDAATNTCYNQNCGYRREFNSTGDMMAFSLTLEPYWNLGNDWTVGIEAGPALYRYTWTSFATNLQNSPGHFGPYDTAGAVETFKHAPRWYPGALVGASIGYKHVSLRYNYLYSPSKWEDGVPSGVKGVHMLTANYTW